jgi:hypothetical protein
MTTGDGVGYEDTLMLNFADALSRTNSFLRANVSVKRISILSLLMLLSCSLGLLVGSASALDGIDLSSPAEPTADGECPRLIQIKYPFLSCADGQIGQSDANETWDNSRQIPMMSDWTEGDSVFGPDFSLID